MPEQKLVKADEGSVASFLEGLVDGRRHFRYYQKRPVAIIRGHLITTILKLRDGGLAAYGHLEDEGGKLWLGIAVADQYRRRGYGSLMLDHLIGYARTKQRNEIYLSVDQTNIAALSLYKRSGFTQHMDRENILILKLKIN